MNVEYFEYESLNSLPCTQEKECIRKKERQMCIVKIITNLISVQI